jgi:hypothetical protein
VVVVLELVLVVVLVVELVLVLVVVVVGRAAFILTRISSSVSPGSAPILAK